MIITNLELKTAIVPITVYKSVIPIDQNSCFSLLNIKTKPYIWIRGQRQQPDNICIMKPLPSFFHQEEFVNWLHAFKNLEDAKSNVEALNTYSKVGVFEIPLMSNYYEGEWEIASTAMKFIGYI